MRAIEVVPEFASREEQDAWVASRRRNAALAQRFQSESYQTDLDDES